MPPLGAFPIPKDLPMSFREFCEDHGFSASDPTAIDQFIFEFSDDGLDDFEATPWEPLEGDEIDLTD